GGGDAAAGSGGGASPNVLQGGTATSGTSGGPEAASASLPGRDPYAAADAAQTAPASEEFGDMEPPPDEPDL
ncbi:hypothetical protein, partial [Bifidobacterium catulorum]